VNYIIILYENTIRIRSYLPLLGNQHLFYRALCATCLYHQEFEIEKQKFSYKNSDLGKQFLLVLFELQ